MNMKKAFLIGMMFALISLIIILLIINFCKGGEFSCYISALLPMIPGIILSKIFGINEALNIFGIAIDVYLSILSWFLIGFLGTLLVQWIKSKIKK